MGTAATDADTLLLKYAASGAGGGSRYGLAPSEYSDDGEDGPESLHSYLKRDRGELLGILNDPRWRRTTTRGPPAAASLMLSDQGRVGPESSSPPSTEALNQQLSILMLPPEEAKQEEEDGGDMSAEALAQQKWDAMRQKEVARDEAEIATMLALPKLSSLSPRTSKRIARLPRPNEHDLKVLGQLSKDFVMNTSLDVSLKRSELYRDLERGRGRLLTFASGDAEFFSKGEQNKVDSEQRAAARKLRNKKRSMSAASSMHGSASIFTSSSAIAAEVSGVAEVTSSFASEMTAPQSEASTATINDHQEAAKTASPQLPRRPLGGGSALVSESDTVSNGMPSGKNSTADNKDQAVDAVFWQEVNEADASGDGTKSPVLQLRRKLDDSILMHHHIGDVINDKMRRDRLSLPLDFLRRLGRDDYIKERACIAMVYLLKRVLKRTKRLALERWNAMIEFMKVEHLHHAANDIIRTARGYLGRKEADERRVQRSIQDAAALARSRDLAERQHIGAIEMQRVIRGYRHRGFASRARRRRNAATCIQTMVRRVHAQIRVEHLVAKNTLLFESSSTIQRSWRCCRARVLYGLKRRIHRVELGVIWAREKTEEVRLQFERKGAAILISRWWRMIKVRMQFLRYRKLNKGRRTLKIQCSVRCWIARVRVSARRAEHKAYLDQRDNAAAKIQSIYRRNKAKVRVQSIRDAVEVERVERERRIDEARADKIKEIKLFGKTRQVNMTDVHKRLFSAKKMLYSAAGMQKRREIRACTRMQAVYRGNRARKRLAQARMDHHLKLRRELKLARQTATLRVQTRWRANVQRKIFLKRKRRLAATLIQKTWRAMQGRALAMAYLQHTFSSRDIQRVWRGMLGRRLASDRKAEHRRLGTRAVVVQTVARRFLARSRFEVFRERKRYLEEVGLMGREEFRVCRSHLRDSMILRSFRSRGNTRKGARAKDPTGIAWVLFQELASGGRKAAHGADEKAGKSSDMNRSEIRVSNTALARLCNDSHIIDERRVKRASVGTLFAKAKSKLNDKLNFAEFHGFMKILSQQRYPKVSTYRQHGGEDAQLLKMCCEHLVGGDNPKKHRRQLRTKLLRRMAKTLDRECDGEVAHYATLMQAVSRGVACRNRFAKLLTQAHLHEERQRLERAAMLIEAHLRKIFARAGAEKLASRTIQKFVDPVTREAYYYNPKTGITSWDKPDILGKSDVVDPQVLPDKNVEFVVVCANCDKSVAESFCFPCGDGYCKDCFATLHRKGKKHEHAQTEIPQCHLCLYQAATRRIKGALKPKRQTIHSKGKKERQVKSQFCDSCYEHRRHVEVQECKMSKPRRKPPPDADWIVQPCAECEARACRWKCLDCDDFYCTKCFSHVHARGNRAKHRYAMLSYYTVEMEEQRMRLKRERRQKHIAQMRAREFKLRVARAQEKIARWGQARFLGNKGRAYGIPFLKAGRAEMRRMYRVTKADDKIRATAKYKMQNVIGASPILESDSPEEKARKERAFMHDPKGNIKYRLQQAVIFKIPPHLEGKQLPGMILAREGETETETTVDLRTYLKRGDRIRIDYGIFTIPIEGGFRAPIEGYDDLEDIDPDTHLVKDDPPRFTKMFLPLDRAWPWPTEDSEELHIYKLKPLRPREQPTTKLGKAMEAVNHFFSDKSIVNQLKLSAKGNVQRIAGNGFRTVGEKTGWKYGKKAAECLTLTSRYNMQRSVVPRRTIDPRILERRRWSATFDDNEGREYFTNRETEEVTWKKPECMMSVEELKVFRAENAAEKAREDEIAAQKADMEWKKKQRDMAKSKRGRGKRGRGRR